MEAIVNLEQLKPYLNNNGILEIVMRDKNKKYKTFQKLAIQNAPGTEAKEMLNKAMVVLNKNTALSEKNLAMLKNVSKLQQLNLVFGALNLCATCVGFAIMYAKLDKMSGQINQLMSVVKKGHEVQANLEFRKVLSEHQNMLDARKTQKYYTEDQMRKLVDDECNILEMLIEVFLKDTAGDRQNIVFSIYSMASMFAVSLRYFDELYYFNNKEAIGDGAVWHSSHERWMNVLGKLLDEGFVKRIQDHGVFDLNLSVFETDIYYQSLNEQVMDMRESISDNQELIKELDNEELISAFAEYVNKEVADDIHTAIQQTEDAADNPEVMNACQETMKQMAIVV